MDRSSRTIILVDNSNAVTGASKALVTIVKSLREKFNFVIVSQSPEIFQHEELNIPILKMNFIELSKSIYLLAYPFQLVYNTWRLKKLADRFNADVIHYNDCYNLSGILLKIIQPKHFLIYHVRLLSTSYISSIYPVLIRVIFRYADKVICNSLATCSQLPSSNKKIHISDSIEIQTVTSGIKKGSSPNSILYVGNYIEGKGQEFALSCMHELLKLRQDFKIKFVGGTMGKQGNQWYKERLKEKANELELNDYVEFCDFEFDLGKIYSQATLLLNLSRSESFSMVCAEAMTHGLAVICLNSGGPSEYIINNDTGILLDKGIHASGVAFEINDLLNDQQKLRKISISGKDYIIKNYSVQQIMPKLELIYLGE